MLERNLPKMLFIWRRSTKDAVDLALESEFIAECMLSLNTPTRKGAGCVEGVWLFVVANV